MNTRRWQSSDTASACMSMGPKSCGIFSLSGASALSAKDGVMVVNWHSCGTYPYRLGWIPGRRVSAAAPSARRSIVSSGTVATPVSQNSGFCAGIKASAGEASTTTCASLAFAFGHRILTESVRSLSVGVSSLL